MRKKTLFWSFVTVAIIAVAAIQFVPAPALVIPAEIPAEQRDAHRLLNFEGIANFRDLGGYPTIDGRQVKWGVLYRAGTLAESSRADLRSLEKLNIDTLIDFRSASEKEAEPNHLPDPTTFKVVEIPTLDDGNEAMVEEIMERIERSDFDGFDPNQLMLEGNRQFASTFTPQFREFIQTVLQANGAPVLWHCSAGKDRTGFASAILLRILGVPQEVVLQDYMASKQNALDARSSQLMLLRLFKGDEAADKLSVMLGVEEDWLKAAFEQIDDTWGSFNNYVHRGLKLSNADIAHLKATLLSPPAGA
ncbi:Tyrosine-protein phosphatase [Halioglobus japonicus]|nr:Tyrosine-protein phosphatase [Halioglobus japonicus]